MMDGIAARRGCSLGFSVVLVFLTRRTGLSHGRQVFLPSLRRQVADMPVCQAAAARVVAYEIEVAFEKTHPVPPDRAFVIVVEMGEPGCGLEQRPPRPSPGPGEAESVGGLQELNGLRQECSSRLIVADERNPVEEGCDQPPERGRRIAY